MLCHLISIISRFMLLNSTVNPFYFHYGTNKMRFYPLGIDWMKSVQKSLLNGNTFLNIMKVEIASKNLNIISN